MQILSRLPWWANLEWRTTKILFALCIIEFPLTVAGLALYGIADPNTYRTSLWKEGAVHGWNSDPIEILYSYANYRPIPVPTPWAQFITDFNVVIIVLSMFILLAKVTMYIIHVLPPLPSTIIHGILTALYAVSISQQAASDYSDPDHPSKVPWYLTHGCGDPVASNLKGYCMQAKASFAVAVCLCALFFTYFVVSLICAIPTASQRISHELHNNNTSASSKSSPQSTYSNDKKQWGGNTDVEMEQYQPMPKTPMTPRTMAFNKLEGKPVPKFARGFKKSQAPRPASHSLMMTGAAAEGDSIERHPDGRPLNKDLPLRHHISMGTETFKGKGVAV